jgi:ribA/ribD-fused uncharacterized protein
MKQMRNVADLIAAGPPWDLLHFWGHTPKAAGTVDKSCLSQWYPAPFTVGAVRFATAEHWMMVGKARLFGDAAAEAKILSDDDPAAAKRAGREVRGFDGAKWSAACFELVVEGNAAKFEQNAALRDFLVGTGDKILVEAAPNDAIWGIALRASDADAQDPRRWKGTNLLGFALMQVRARLR